MGLIVSCQLYVSVFTGHENPESGLLGDFALRPGALQANVAKRRQLIGNDFLDISDFSASGLPRVVAQGDERMHANTSRAWPRRRPQLVSFSATSPFSLIDSVFAEPQGFTS